VAILIIHFVGVHVATSMTERTKPVIVDPHTVTVFEWPEYWA
jgi:hypothetical protein